MGGKLILVELSYRIADIPHHIPAVQLVPRHRLAVFPVQIAFNGLGGRHFQQGAAAACLRLVVILLDAAVTALRNLRVIALAKLV